MTDHPHSDFLISLDSYNGPLDVLLDLARQKKFDLLGLPITLLADQYIAFIRQHQKLQLEIAADYLVMACWLAWLKSRLLLPEVEKEEDVLSPEEQVEQLQRRLQHLQLIRDRAKELNERPHLGRDMFVSGFAPPPHIEENIYYTPRLYNLLSCYGQIKRKKEGGILQISHTNLCSPTEALKRLRAMMGNIPDWTDLMVFIPEDETDLLVKRSTYAGFLCASLELARQGKIIIRQEKAYAPISIKQSAPTEEPSHDKDPVS